MVPWYTEMDGSTQKKNFPPLPYVKGLATGLLLQIAIGPVFFLVLGINLSGGFFLALAGIVAVTLVDCLYMALSILGLARLLKEEKYRRPFGILSSLVLLIFGLYFLVSSLSTSGAGSPGPAKDWTLVESFLACLVLTGSSPLTVVFWAGIFASKASSEGYQARQLVFFGLGAGTSTFLFLSLAMLALSYLGAVIPKAVMVALNVVVAVLLLIYALRGLFKVIKSSLKPA